MAILKAGVVWTDMHPSMEAARSIADAVFLELAGREAIITSARDPAPFRVPDTLHQLGRAIDLRTFDITPAVRGQVIDQLRARLGDGYQVIYEPAVYSRGKLVKGEHIHVQFRGTWSGGGAAPGPGPSLPRVAALGIALLLVGAIIGALVPPS